MRMPAFMTRRSFRRSGESTLRCGFGDGDIEDTPSTNAIAERRERMATHRNDKFDPTGMRRACVCTSSGQGMFDGGKAIFRDNRYCRT